jgi:hypothetical protein
MHPWRTFRYGNRKSKNYNTMTTEQKRLYWDSLEKLTEMVEQDSQEDVKSYVSSTIDRNPIDL